jgi:hypothetical protein
VWHEPWVASWILNGSIEPRPPDLEVLEQWFSNPRVRADLASVPIENPFQLLNLFVMADEEVRNWTRGAPLVTDDHTRIDFSVPRSRQSFFGVSNHISNYYLVAQMGLEVDFQGLADLYCRPKQPVWRRLHAGGFEPEKIRRRLVAELGRLPFGGCIGEAQRPFARAVADPRRGSAAAHPGREGRRIAPRSSSGRPRAVSIRRGGER